MKNCSIASFPGRFALVFLFFVTVVFGQDYDLVILNGRVMDPETNFDGIRNVGIKGDRIHKITEEKTQLNNFSLPSACTISINR